MSAALLLSVCIGVGVGIYAALRRGRPQETVIVVLTVISYATPVFWVGLMLIVLFSINLGWLPTSGMETIGGDKEGLARALDIGRHLVLPAVTLSLFYMALYTRLMRAAMLETLGTDFVITAHAKGLKRRRIIWLHVFRNAILPIVTMIGIQIGGLLGGSVIVESVFGWPGLGLLAFEALFARDLNLLLSIFFLSSVLVVFANIAVDLLYGVLDPRIRLA
jgi:peptide/nickel transport system permease protein